MMEPQEANSMTLNTLLSVAQEVAPHLPEQLIRRVFAIQRAHQFDVDPSASILEVQRVVEEYVTQAGNNEEAA